MRRVRFIEMSDYNRPARIYWSVMVAAGTLTGIWGLSQCLAYNARQWAELLALLSLVVLTSSYPIRIPNTKASVTAGGAFMFFRVFVFGVPAGPPLGGPASFLWFPPATTRATG